MARLTDPAEIKAQTTYTWLRTTTTERWGSGPRPRGTLARAALEPGQVVLDVACRSGSTAIPAAERVAPSGRVIEVDLDEWLPDPRGQGEEARAQERGVPARRHDRRTRRRSPLKRIDLGWLDWSAVDAAHEEIPLAFTVRLHSHLRGG